MTCFHEFVKKISLLIQNIFVGHHKCTRIPTNFQPNQIYNRRFLIGKKVRENSKFVKQIISELLIGFKYNQKDHYKKSWVLEINEIAELSRSFDFK